jgi:hypothetical protein
MGAAIMSAGPGKYDALATYVRNTAEAEGAIVIVVRGRLGSGFSVQAQASLGALELGRILRLIADGLEREGSGGE